MPSKNSTSPRPGRRSASRASRAWASPTCPAQIVPCRAEPGSNLPALHQPGRRPGGRGKPHANHQDQAVASHFPQPLDRKENDRAESILPMPRPTLRNGPGITSRSGRAPCCGKVSRPCHPADRRSPISRPVRRPSVRLTAGSGDPRRTESRCSRCPGRLLPTWWAWGKSVVKFA